MTAQISRTEVQTQAAWDRIAAGYDEYVTSTHLRVADEGLRRAGVGPGTRFLDVAAGSGALSIPAARLGAEVLAVDISPAMLERLQARAHREGLHVETRVMDGHHLDLEDNSFDVTGSEFGVMLFPDMPRGIREMARVTRPGGRVLMNVLGDPHEVQFFHLFVEAAKRAAPGFEGPPMDPPPLPFQLQDPERLRRELANAGLSDIRVETVTETLEFRTATDMWNWLVNSNPIVETVLGGITPAQRAAAPKALEGLLRERFGDAPAVLTDPVHIGIGRK